MRASACLAIAFVVFAGCAPGSSADRGASFSAVTDTASARSYCAGIAVTPEDHANCVSRWASNDCSAASDRDNCIAAERGAVRDVCGVHVVFSEYADCVGIGENRIGGWPSSEDDDD
jgi:hypothetical protein